MPSETALSFGGGSATGSDARTERSTRIAILHRLCKASTTRWASALRGYCRKLPSSSQVGRMVERSTRTLLCLEFLVTNSAVCDVRVMYISLLPPYDPLSPPISLPLPPYDPLSPPISLPLPPYDPLSPPISLPLPPCDPLSPPISLPLPPGAVHWQADGP